MAGSVTLGLADRDGRRARRGKIDLSKLAGLRGARMRRSHKQDERAVAPERASDIVCRECGSLNDVGSCRDPRPRCRSRQRSHAVTANEQTLDQRFPDVARSARHDHVTQDLICQRGITISQVAIPLQHVDDRFSLAPRESFQA
jgi:hypothetical protein